MIKHCCFFIIFILLPVSFSLLGEKAVDYFEYSRSGLLHGEVWRIFFCHFTHINWHHVFLNILGALLIYILLGNLYSLTIWAVAVTGCAIGVSVGLLFFHPEILWYRGLSGVLHGLFMMGVIRGMRQGNVLYCFAFLGITAKLISELISGPGTISAGLLNAPVISEAHFYGSAMGLFLPIALSWWEKHKLHILFRPLSLSSQKNLQ